MDAQALSETDGLPAGTDVCRHSGKAKVGIRFAKCAAGPSLHVGNRVWAKLYAGWLPVPMRDGPSRMMPRCQLARDRVTRESRVPKGEPRTEQKPESVHLV